MKRQAKLILYVLIIAKIANCENVKPFKFVKEESEGYNNSSRDQDSKLKGTSNPSDDKNLGRKQIGFNDAFGNNMESSVPLRKQYEGHEFNSRPKTNYNDNVSEIYRPNMEGSVYWGNQPQKNEFFLRKNTDFNEYGNGRNPVELQKGYNWNKEKDMRFVQDPQNSFDFKRIQPSVMIEAQKRPDLKPDWESLEGRQTVLLGDRNSKSFTNPYSDLRSPYKYIRREYITEPNTRELTNNFYNIENELVSTHPRYPVQRIFDFNDENDNLQRSNFYKADKGLVINLKTECPRESKQGIMHKIFFSSEPHLNDFPESGALNIPGTSLVSSSPVYYL